MTKLIYLYVYFDDNPRQSESPPTPLDISLVESNILQVYRWYFDAYEILTIQNGKLIWEKVQQAELCHDDELAGEYHA